MKFDLQINLDFLNSEFKQVIFFKIYLTVSCVHSSLLARQS